MAKGIIVNRERGSWFSWSDNLLPHQKVDIDQIILQVPLYLQTATGRQFSSLGAYVKGC